VENRRTQRKLSELDQETTTNSRHRAPGIPTQTSLAGSERSHHALKELANKIPKKNLKGNSDGIKIGI